MALQLIQNTDTNTCSTDGFLDSLVSLVSLEHVDESGPRLPLSPVFRDPSEPYPHYDVFTYYYRYYYYYGEMMSSKVRYLSCTHSYESYQFSKNYYKNKNKYFRKQRRIHQPGGASCDQRR